MDTDSSVNGGSLLIRIRKTEEAIKNLERAYEELREAQKRVRDFEGLHLGPDLQ